MKIRRVCFDECAIIHLSEAFVNFLRINKKTATYDMNDVETENGIY